MRRRVWVVLLALVLAGCGGGVSTEAEDLCVDAVRTSAGSYGVSDDIAIVRAWSEVRDGVTVSFTELGGTVVFSDPDAPADAAFACTVAESRGVLRVVDVSVDEVTTTPP